MVVFFDVDDVVDVGVVVEVEDDGDVYVVVGVADALVEDVMVVVVVWYRRCVSWRVQCI